MAIGAEMANSPVGLRHTFQDFSPELREGVQGCPVVVTRDYAVISLLRHGRNEMAKERRCCHLGFSLFCALALPGSGSQSFARDTRAFDGKVAKQGELTRRLVALGGRTISSIA